MKKRSGNILIVVLSGIAVISLALAGYFFYQNQPFDFAQGRQRQAPKVEPVVSTPTPIPTAILIPTPLPKQENGVKLQDIKYRLPLNWTAKMREEILFLSPIDGGGYLAIHVYDYSGNVGRREYYCKVRNVCIEGTSYFTEMTIGNISGYAADALDNSGGGRDYFGAKGNKFYIIGSFSPPSPNEFDKNYKKVLDSLSF